MIKQVKIHPAIGIARIGNSPTEFFIGPERPFEAPDPVGGFKDELSRVKRQAARFRVFAYHDDGSVTELGASEAEIAWTVQVANKKAAVNDRNEGGDAAQLTISAGPHTLDGPEQRAALAGGSVTFPGGARATVPLGELRTDEHGRLVFLGGLGESGSPGNTSLEGFYDNAGWYDDVCDGPVRATVRVKTTGAVFEAAGAWVIVAPPKFAPQLDSIVTLYDRVLAVLVARGWRTAPERPSYSRDIHPILLRTANTRWVTKLGDALHAWPEPVTSEAARRAIFSRVRDPKLGAPATAGSGSGARRANMPLLLGEATVTPVQYAMLRSWSEGSFVDDWAGPPEPGPLTPEGLDRAALDACTGAAFFPGIEAGGMTEVPILDPATYVGSSDPLRINHATREPGDLTAYMALPWQADFYACDDNWWPVPRPNWVLPRGEPSKKDWDRGVDSYLDMIKRWHTLGFVVREGSAHVEVDRSESEWMISCTTPCLVYRDVAQGPAGIAGAAARAVVFEVSAPRGAVTLEYASGPKNPRFSRLNLREVVGPTEGHALVTVRLWISYQTGAAGETIEDSVTVRHVESGRTWEIGLIASTVARPATTIAVVLDRSRSMAAADLKAAATVLLDLAHEGDGVGLVRFEQKAELLQAVTVLDGPGKRSGARSALRKRLARSTLGPLGSTSIGAGLVAGLEALRAAPAAGTGALVLLSDGHENSAPWVVDVAPLLDARVYVVDPGTTSCAGDASLAKLAEDGGGYRIVVGERPGALAQCMTQVFADISGAEVVLTSGGVLTPGATRGVSFLLTERDDGIEVILTAAQTDGIGLKLRTPDGLIIDPKRVGPGRVHVVGEQVVYYRIVLPAELAPGRFDQEGCWEVLVTLAGAGSPAAPRTAAGHPTSAIAYRRPTTASTPVGHQVTTVDFGLAVHSYSRLALRTRIVTGDAAPGTQVSVHAKIVECGVIAVPAVIKAEVIHPDGSAFELLLAAGPDHGHVASFTADAAGIYTVRIRARGESRRGHVFEREQVRTIAIGSREADMAGRAAATRGRAALDAASLERHTAPGKRPRS